jgi:hypothetical protein
MPRTRYVDLEGKRFGKLQVQKRVTPIGISPVKWLVLCDCGNSNIVATQNMTNGTTSSCGCLRRKITSEKFKTHGQHGSPAWQSWTSMKTRCNNPNSTQYELYGGRGIKVCERWEKFENFLEDMGERPEGKTLDRIDVNKNYEPMNCKWSTKKEQSQNRRKLKLINKDSFSKFLETQEYLNNQQRKKIVDNFFKEKGETCLKSNR